MKFRGIEIENITVDLIEESLHSTVGIRCTKEEAHKILDFIDSHNSYQVIFRPSYKTEYDYYVHFNSIKLNT